MMAAFSDLCIASEESEDVSDTTLEKLIGLFNGQFEECLIFVDASLRVFIPRLASTIKKCEEDLKREKGASLKREKEWREKAKEVEKQENQWGLKAKQWREKMKQMNDSWVEKEGLLNDERAKRTKLEAEVDNLATQVKKVKSKSDVLQESLAEYKGMSKELNGVLQELDKKDAKILSLQRQLEDVSLVKPGRKEYTKDVAHTSEPSGFMCPSPVLEKRENPVLAASSPSKSCPPLERPKIVIPETLGFGDDSVGVKRQSINCRDRDRQSENPSEPQKRKQTNALAQTDRLKGKPPSRKSSLILSTQRADRDEDEKTHGATSKHQTQTNEPPLPQLPPTLQMNKNKSDTTSSHQTAVEFALSSQSQPLSDEDENQVSSSPLLGKKTKLKSKLASRKRRKLVEEQSSANSVSSLSSLSEPWLSCISGTKRSQNDGTSRSPAGAKKTSPMVTATSLSNWDPKDGKRQATVTQMFDPGNVSERAKKDQQIRGREEEDLRLAMQESLKMTKTQSSGGQSTEKPYVTATSTTETTSFLDTTMIDLELAEVHQATAVSETQALNLINSPAECTARIFSKACGFATKSQLSKNQPKPVCSKNSRSAEKGGNSSSSGLPIESPESCKNSTPEVLSIIPQKAAITSATSLISDSPFLQTVTGSSDAFVTPAKNKGRRKKRKATPNPQLDEIFGESDAESDVSFITPPTAMTTTTIATSTIASCSTNGVNRVEPSSGQPISSSEPQDPRNSSLNDSAFLTFSQVKRGKDEERRKVVSEQGGVSHKSKDFREELKRTDCEKCGKEYLALGFSAEEANKKIWEKCPHGRGKDAENRCETPPHLWHLGPMKKKGREEEERSRNANQEAVGTKRPRRKKPLGVGSSSPKEDD